ncbi:Hypothetical protein SRAE_1000130200 [Strongyloides ratti]|uniref:Uncharacterized protein n=1 Tax=Strongyloides ratti TaxID=34506 RepID=A0A090L032_STRRB|nr:Hypothetical protein SRAE_1000130200 [Strongyloides ratti]CEF63036.1 Hypothetical protein SRAE_1000130200 [Strongyloides ratti]
MQIVFVLYIIFNAISTFSISTLIQENLAYKNIVSGCHYQSYCIRRILDVEILYGFKSSQYYAFTFHLFFSLTNGYVVTILLQNFKKHTLLFFVFTLLSLISQIILYYLIYLYNQMITVFLIYGLNPDNSLLQLNYSLALIIIQFLLNMVCLLFSIIFKDKVK